MRAFLPAALLNLIRSEHGRSLRKLGLLHAMLCINALIAHIDMYIFVSQLIFSSEIFHVQVRLKTLQLGRLKDSSNNLLALKGCTTTSASICGNWHPLADHILPLSLSNNSEMGQQVWHCSFKVRQTKQGDSQLVKAMPHWVTAVPP